MTSKWNIWTYTMPTYNKFAAMNGNTQEEEDMLHNYIQMKFIRRP